MEIRPDLQTAAAQLTRLVEYANAFDANNREVWPHLKNEEDFAQVYQLPWPEHRPLDEVYRTGRDLAKNMASRLIEFNDPRRFPTLLSFVDSFANSWIEEIGRLSEISRVAKEVSSQLERSPWSVEQMINLFDQQTNLLVAVKQTIDSLRRTDIYQTESGLTDRTIHCPEYRKILDCIHKIGRMFERHPSTYAGKDEEHLRDHILVALSTAVTGSSTGETFNKRGKTDILVRRADGTNEFVGECKFWNGEAAFSEAIDQLLGYLTWRDNQAGIILFVPNKRFTSVLKTIAERTQRHRAFSRLIEQKDETWLNYEFRMNDDPERVVSIAVMPYHLPAQT